jgi:hypothetical protein
MFGVSWTSMRSSFYNELGTWILRSEFARNAKIMCFIERIEATNKFWRLEPDFLWVWRGLWSRVKLLSEKGVLQGILSRYSLAWFFDQHSFN